MSSSPKLLALAAVFTLGLGSVSAQSGAASYAGIGRDATPKEVAAWDIDVRPDFKGLPKGSGSVAAGQDVWEGKCAQCHGIFGESSEVFSPLVGGVTPEDVKSGRVANLQKTTFPGRTTLMKVATVSTLWDYINRAMPWTAPKSLKTDEVYAVTAFLLNLGGIVPDNFVLSDKTIAEAQARMPNRLGMNTQHALWPGPEFNSKAKPDTQNVACMKDCRPEPKIGSILPDYARNNHGNLAEQNRPVGQQKGVDTTRPEGTVVAAAPTVAVAPKTADPALALLDKYSCTACHAMGSKLVGPAFRDVARKHADKLDYLATKIKSGGVGVWGQVPMPPQTISDSEAQTVARWIAGGAKP